MTVEEEVEVEEESEHSEEWLNTFIDEAEETATWEFAAGAEEKRKKTYVLLICSNNLKLWKRG
jgi:uncharacterized protein YggL (DUF469 family)